jgi:hypothetical protein
MKRWFCVLITLLVAGCHWAVLAEDGAVFSLPGKSNELTPDLALVKVSKVCQITGEDSENKTQSRFGVWGTDLGSMTEMNGKVYMFCGDTFSDERNSDWRSNVLFVIEDDDPSDGLTITGTIPDKWGRAKELLLSRKSDHSQITVIPTNIFAVGNTLYCIFMSVKHWGDAGGVWECGYSGLAKSEDEGQTWKKLTDVTWPGDSNFIQTANCLIGDTMYLWGIPAGRFGGVALMKAPADRLEDMAAYSYFTGTDADGLPVWIQGSDGIQQAKLVIDAPVGELSVIYNPYLGNFIMTYLREGRGLVMREGVTPWGEWGKDYLLAAGSKYPSLYGGFMCDKYIENGGQTFYFAMSQFFPIYNIMWMKAELPGK